jgi:hypothetical protein
MADNLPQQFYDLHRLILMESAAVLDSLGEHQEATEVTSKKDRLVPVSNQ